VAEPALDDATLATLLETVGDDRTFLAELVDTYLADSPPLFATMRAALAADDRVALRRAAHTLKSTSTSLGALRLAATCREIESHAADGEGAWLAVRIEAAATEYAGANAALRSRVDDTPAP
jgi:HPt (histidine-containing phosphotransfer) domain-containing protein